MVHSIRRNNVCRVAQSLCRCSSSTAYTWFESIGSPRFISAPMVSQSEMAFRALTRRHGSQLGFTQMIHSRNFVHDHTYRSRCIDWIDYTPTAPPLPSSSSGPARRFGTEETAESLDRNLVVQLAGHCEKTLAECVRLLHSQRLTSQASSNMVAVDLNLGCPQNIAKRGHYGAYLLADRPLVVRLLKAMVSATGGALPVTAKIRRLVGDEETLDLARAIEDCGVSMLTVHGRTLEERKGRVGKADWDIVKKIKKELSIPVVANGGVQTRSEALACLAYTGCDAVMASEGLLENPKLFSVQSEEERRCDYIGSQLATAEEYLALLCGHPLPYQGMQVARAHLFKMLYRLLDAPKHTDIRDRMGETANLEELCALVSELRCRMEPFVVEAGRGMVEGRGLEAQAQAEAQARGFLGPTDWYFRHRDKSSDAAPAVSARAADSEQQRGLKERLQRKYRPVAASTLQFSSE